MQGAAAASAAAVAVPARCCRAAAQAEALLVGGCRCGAVQPLQVVCVLFALKVLALAADRSVGRVLLLLLRRHGHPATRGRAAVHAC